jgi:GNAT superfamily N-acetyltransferase
VSKRDSATTFEFTVAETATEGPRATILALLQAYNHAHAGPAAATPLAILLHDRRGKAVGGLHATSAYDWLIVELVFVPKAMRGRGAGSALLARAEEIARARGCTGVWLDTFSFQARGFYERLGYRVFGAVENHPAGAERYFLKKILA